MARKPGVTEGALVRAVHEDLTHHFKSVQRMFEKQLAAACDRVGKAAKACKGASPADAAAAVKRLDEAISQLQRIRDSVRVKGGVH